SRERERQEDQYKSDRSLKERSARLDNTKQDHYIIDQGILYLHQDSRLTIIHATSKLVTFFKMQT
ncbi:unnamed protein product, partial [Brassica oleracea var. botrytis]